MHNRPLNAWIVVDAQGALTKNRYQVSSYPTTILIDKTGNLDAITNPNSLTEAAFDNLLAGKPSGLARPPAPVIVRQPGIAQQPAVADKDKTQPIFSISLKKQPIKGGGTSSSNTHYSMYSGSVTDVLKWVYEIAPFRIIYKDSFPDSRWTVDAVFPDGQVGLVKEYFKKMVQPGWGMTIKEGKQEMEIYVMKYDKGSSNSKANKSYLTAADPALRSGHLSGSEGTMLASNWSFSRILDQCEQLLGQLVIDETNLQGSYDLSLFYKEGDAASIIEALKDCGIIVTKEKRMMEVLLVSNNKINN